MTFRQHFSPRLLALALALPIAAGAQRGGDRVDTTLTIDRGGALQLGLISGEIRVIGEQRADVRIVAHTEAGRFETSYSGSRISLNTRSVNGRTGVTRFDVAVPVGTRVTATSISGTIEVRGTGAEVVARTTSGTLIIRDASDRVEAMSISGDIEMRNVKGRIRAETTSGDVRVDDASGEMISETVSGSTSLRRSAFDGIRATAVSGSITYEGPLSRDGSYRFNAHSGSVLLVVPANVAATLELETFSGRITTDFPLVLQPGSSTQRGRRMEFTLGAGGARVVAGAFSGNITIRRGSAADNRE